MKNSVRESSATQVSLDYTVAAPASPDAGFPSTTSKILPGIDEETKQYWNDDAIPSTYSSQDFEKGNESNGGNINEKLAVNSSEVIPLSEKTVFSGEAPLGKSYSGESRNYENNPLLGVDKDTATVST